MNIIEEILDEMDIEEEDEILWSFSTLRKSWGEILKDINSINNSDSLEIVANKEITGNEREKSFEIIIRGKKAYLYKTKESKLLLKQYLKYIQDVLVDGVFIRGIVIKVRKKTGGGGGGENRHRVYEKRSPENA